MATSLTFENVRYFLVANCPFSLTEDNLSAVDELWGYDLEAHLGAYQNLYVFAPFDPKYEADTYGYVFSEKSTITFHHLFNLARDHRGRCATGYEMVKNLLKILSTLVRHTTKQDIIQSVGPAVNLIVPLTHIFCAIVRHNKRILVLDTDIVEDVVVAKQAEPRRIRKLFLSVEQYLMNLTTQLMIATTPLTFVVGNSLYSRYSRIGNVKKIYASWLSNDDIISPSDLGTKVRAAKKNGSYRLVYAARLVHKKRPDIAVKAIAILHQKGVPITLDIYGAGPMYDSLLDLVKKNNLSSTVTFKGTVNYDTFLNVLTEYDILIMPNVSGEQPRVPFDAMAKGVLVVASDIISLRDIIISGYNGVLCDPENPDSFASAIERLYSSKTDMEPLLRNGLQTVKPRTLESMHENRKAIIQATFSGD